MKEIELTRGYKTLVDDGDFADLSQHKWYVARAGKNEASFRFYANRQYRDGKKQVFVSMHRYLMDAPKGVSVDHIDGNSLNNQRYNLRFSTHAENLRNRRAAHNREYKGVYPADRKKFGVDCYSAVISKDYKRYNLGVFLSKIKAAEAYDRLARLLHGEFACLNFPKEGEQGCRR